GPPWPLGNHLGTSRATSWTTSRTTTSMDPSSTMSSTLVLTIYALTFAVGFPANVFTLAVLVAKSRRRPVAPDLLPVNLSSADLLLLNLTMADLLLLVFLPFKMAEAAAGMTWPLPAALCPVANFCFYSSM
ncbi:FFAR3 protein, partial [Falcunculus frontatus]|nr:FFAR3 protein [Falcunculus frontatus]